MRGDLYASFKEESEEVVVMKMRKEGKDVID